MLKAGVDRLLRRHRRLQIARIAAIRQLISRHPQEFRALLARTYREMGT